MERSLGAFQTTNARIALKRLERSGLLKLPPAQRFGGRAKSRRSKPGMELPSLGGNLAQIGPVELVLVGSRHSQASRQCRQLLQEFHPLGDRLCGAQTALSDPLPRVCWAWFVLARRPGGCGRRDQWVGWSDTARGENLHRIVNNSRFLIRPGVESGTWLATSWPWP